MALKDLKFLSLDGLSIVVQNIKDIIATEAAKTPIDTTNTSYTATNATLTVKQKGYEAKTLTINAAGENAGLMSKADKAKLDGIASGAQVNVIEGIVVRAEGDTDSAIAMTTIVDGKKLVIDNIGTISATVPTDTNAALKDKKLAPTAKAVRDYVTSVQTSLGGNISGLTTRMDQAENDIDQLGVDLAAEKTARETTDNTIIGDLDKVETFLGTLSDNNTKAANVYNKTEANNAIADAVNALETKLLGADRDQINDAYETLKGIADWIAEDTTGAAALGARVEQAEKDIDALESKDTEILNTIGPGYSTTNTVATAITALQNNLSDEIARSTTKENELNTAITNEVSRAKAAEKEIADDLSLEITNRENGDATLQNNIDTLSTTVNNNNNAINTKVNELKYVLSINHLASDDNGNLTITYKVNNDTDKTIEFGSIIQKTEIDALFSES